jgi:methylated-DNA-protein-cysteine methyltransferase-like protein
VDEVMAGKSTVTYERIYLVISDIPRGRVATYGQIAELAGIAGQARRIGYALSALPQGSVVPWHRVINASGGISVRPRSKAAKLQRRLLEAEGVVFGKDARINLARFRWRS